MSDNVLDVLLERGFVKDVSDLEGLRRQLDRPTTVYDGFDATAKSFHVGNQVGFMMLAWLQRYGHRPIALMGGGTTMVGDPSGRSTERPILTPLEIDRNLEHLRPQIGRFVDFDRGALMLDNSGWLLPLHLIEFLRDVGAKFTVNHMLAHETYRTRLEQGGLSFLEFSYQLVQAFDFLHLYRQYDCRVQIGGSDQWANILAGVDLIRRDQRQEVYGLVCPLITTAGGAKMGKTGSGTVWLDPAMVSPYEYYQYWINVDDADVEPFLCLFTFLPMDDVRRLGSLSGAELRAAKEALALEATRIVHGGEAAEEAQRASRALFGGEGEAEAAPTVPYAGSKIEAGVPIADLLVETGACSSKREARRLIEAGGVTLGGSVVGAPERIVRPSDLDGSGRLLLRIGKKRFLRVRAE